MPSILFRFIVVSLTFCPAYIFAGSQSIPAFWTVGEAVEYALENNPDSRMAALRIEVAQAKIAEANSALLPRITLQGGYAQTNDPLASFGNILHQNAFQSNIDFNNPGRTDNLNARIEALYTIYNGGKDLAAISSAEFHQISRQEERTAVMQQLAFEVVRAFQQIVQAEEMVAANASSRAAIEASLAVAKARYEAGDLLREDLLNLEVQEARASENLIQARHALSLSHHAFNNLLGITAGPVAIVAASGSDQEIPRVLDYSGRPELKAIAMAIASAQAQLEMARADTGPVLNSFATYQYDYGFINDDYGDSWTAGVKISYSLYDGQATLARIAEKSGHLAELQVLKRKTELALNLDLQEAEQILRQADERMVVTAKMVRLAEESARLSRARFKEGLILSSDLIDVETRLTDALVRNSQAGALYRTAIANLRKSVGLQQF
jgi:outer membrane protein TolC